VVDWLRVDASGPVEAIAARILAAILGRSSIASIGRGTLIQ
jgi:hypothetical protein